MADLHERLSRSLTDRYRLQEEIGSGGMASVYLAHDVRHDREVALKVLHPELAAILGAERFLNEIRVTAQLQHPNILPLFDSGDADGLLYYVMPYVEGESLRDHLARERELPVSTAVEIATEVASALDYAHRHGVVHRDIKPGNILLQDGRAMVADFGIALAVRLAGGDRITQTGLSLGTPEYMSPEQASGDRPVDARSDVYALGAVLYEMLAGQPPHTGPTVQAVIASVLTEPPRPLGDLRQTTPVRVSVAVERALAKLPADRFASAAEFAEALSPRPAAQRHEVAAEATGGTAPGHPRSPWLLATLGLALLLAGVLIGRRSAGPTATTGATARLTIDLPDGWAVAPADLASVAISRDGRRVAFVAQSEEGQRLFLRDLSEMEARPLQGTDGALGPFFSPDGEWVGFFADGRLQKVSLSGGAPVPLAGAALARGADWGPDGSILFTSAPGTGLWRVPAGGGESAIVTQLDPGRDERTHRLPNILRDADHVLFTIRRGTQPAFAEAEVALLSMEAGEHRIVLAGGTQPRVLPTGHMVFGRGATLQAVRFDPDDLRAGSEPIAVLEGVMYDPSTGATQFAVSDDGTLVYVSGGAWAASRQLLVQAPGGDAQVAVGNAGPFRSPRFAPDGGRVAVVVEAANDDIWIHDLETGAARRLTFAAGSNVAPLWSPDGERLLFASNREGRYNLYVKDATGGGDATRVTTNDMIHFPTSWHPSGSSVTYTELHPQSGSDIWIVPVEGNAEPEVFLATVYDEYGAAFSPDGEWIAYVSDESGRDEIYLQRYPAAGGKEQVSIEGGVQPRWSPDGGTLYYRNGNKILEVGVTTEPTVSITAPRVALSAEFATGSIGSVPAYDVHPGGSGFLVAGMDRSEPPTRIQVVLNWFAELEGQVPSGND